MRLYEEYECNIKVDFRQNCAGRNYYEVTYSRPNTKLEHVISDTYTNEFYLFLRLRNKLWMI